MSNNPTLLELAGRTPQYGNTMDTVADARAGDVMLTPKGLGAIGSLELMELMHSWGNMLDKANVVDTPTNRSIGSVAIKQLQMLSLMESIKLQNEKGNDESNIVRETEREIFDHFHPGLYKNALLAKIGEIQELDLLSELEPARALVLDELYKYYESVEAESTTIEKPTERTLIAVNRWIQSQYKDAFNRIPECNDGEKLTDSQIVDHFRSIIELTPELKQQGWVVEVVDRQKKAISVYANERKIVVPKGYQATREKLMDLDIHEVFGHALRSARAGMLGNDIGSIGTATYPSFEESFMIVLEQCRHGAYDPSRGVNHYVAIGLSVESKASQESVGRLFRSMGQLNRATGRKAIDQANISASDSAANVQLKRTFAGMMDMDDGVAHMKDIDYLHGVNNAWKILNYLTENDALEEGMAWLLSAKFNPYDAMDRELVNQYINMPGALEPFFCSK